MQIQLENLEKQEKMIKKIKESSLKREYALKS